MPRIIAAVCVLALAGGLLRATPAHADEKSAQAVGRRSCAAISDRVDAIVGAAPLLLRSYDGDGSGAPPVDPSQRTAAYVYDNALAAIALIACRKPMQAQRIGEALRLAAVGDARLRNAYRAGTVSKKFERNGWWDPQGAQWAQDPYQQGSATGNVAWAALAMLALHRSTVNAQWLDAARKLATWVADTTADERGAGGFAGGVEGDDADAHKVMWKSTEHNIDAAALFDRLDELEPARNWRSRAQSARGFVEAQWDRASGHFFVGTLPDGITPNRQTSGLDAQLWPNLLRSASRDWRRSLRYVEREHGVTGGFDFNADRDGLWLEGTAQAALVYRKVGRPRDAEQMLATVAAQFSQSGYVYATREPRITTGLAIGSDSASADFYYYRRPHLAATAWAALAALDRNPFESAPVNRP
jgi:hypothetical protein